MKNLHDDMVKSLFSLSFRSLLIYMFVMANAGVVIANGVTVDRVWVSDSSGVERDVFVPGEGGLVHVDYTIDEDRENRVVAGGKIVGLKVGGQNGDKEILWGVILEKERMKQLPGSHNVSWDFTVNSDAIVGSKASVNVDVKLKNGQNGGGDDSFEIVATLPDLTATVTPLLALTPTPVSIITPTPVVSITPTPIASVIIEPTVESTPTPSVKPVAPVLEPIGDKSVTVGDTLTFTVSASDSNLDRLLFSVTPLPLIDGASFNVSTGEFVFVPNVEQVGSFDLTFIVSDGLVTDSEVITVEVIGGVIDGETSLRGQIMDANDASLGIFTPIVGVTVTNIDSGLSTTSDNDGNFVLGGLKDGENHFEYDGGTALSSDGIKYGSFRGNEVLIANVTNVISRPIFLMRLNSGEEVMVTPDSTTMVKNTDLEVEMEIPARTVINDDGSFYSGMLSISEVPSEFTPASLPENLEPGLVISIQPMGLAFNLPVPITFPNIDNLDPGSSVDIWSLDHNTGEFFVTGVGQVSGDGAMVNTVEGGIRQSSWHLIMPPFISGSGEGNDECQCKGCPPRESVKSGSETGIGDGHLTVKHTLPGYRSLDQFRELSFVYNSDRAHPKPVVSVNVTNPKEATVPLSISSSLSVVGVEQGVEVFTDTSELDQDADDTIRQVLQFDGGDFKTGLYPYRMKISSHFEQSTVSGFTGGNILIDNEKDSPFGVGWTLEGLQRIHILDDGKALVTEGDGSALIFKPVSVGSGEFDASVSHFLGSTSSRPEHIVTGDFNGDGNLDLVIGHLASGSIPSVSFMEGDGDGGFLDISGTIAIGEIGASSSPITLVKADFNNDGKLDLVSIPRRSATDEVFVLIGDGRGGFGDPEPFLAGEDPVDIAVGDFNLDGMVDMAVSNISSDDVSVLLGDGGGAFVKGDDVAVGNGPQSIVASDFNGDGMGDIAVANNNDLNISLLIGDGSGGFGLENGTVTVGAVGSDTFLNIVTADFDGDGANDIAAGISSFSGHKVSVVLNNGDGTFRNPTSFLTTDRLRSIATDDVNNDGILDMVTVGEIDGVSILIGDGFGGFGEPLSFVAGDMAEEVAIGDFDEDGGLDMAVTNFNSSSVTLLFGDGTGLFKDTPRYFIDSQFVTGMDKGDFNNDGIVDIAASTTFGSGVSVLLGVGDGTFSDVERYQAGNFPVSIVAEDLDNDGNVDLAVVNSSSDNVSILLGLGNGRFLVANNIMVGDNPITIESGDFNLDGNVDLAIGNTIDDNLAILLGDGNAGFDISTIDAGNQPSNINSNDFNADGLIDLAVTDELSDDVFIFFGDGTGAFSSGGSFAVGANANPRLVKSGDLDRDGSVDLVVLNFFTPASGKSILNSVVVLFGDGRGSFVSPIVINNSVKAISSFEIDDFDGDGIPDLIIIYGLSNDITVFRGNGSGSFDEQVSYSLGDINVDNAPILVDDFNGDGVRDIAVGNSRSGNSGNVALLLGNSSDQNGFNNPLADFSTILLNGDKTFTRVLKDGNRINFDSKGLQTSTVDRNGNTTTYSYDSEGNLVDITDPVRLKTSFAYSGGVLSRVIDPANRVTLFEHDSNRNLVRIVDADNSTRDFGYFGEMHLMTSQTSKRGFETNYTYDFAGRMVMALLPDGSTNHVIPSETVGLFDKALIVHAENISGVESDDSLTIVENCGGIGSNCNPAPIVRAEDVVALFIDENGNQTTFETDRFGGRNVTVDALGNKTFVTRDENSKATRVEMTNGAITTLSYDDNGNLLTIKEAVGSDIQRQTSFVYESKFNLVIRRTDSLGNATTFDYDDNGNRIKEVDALGGERVFTYDSRGLLLSSIDENGNRITIDYDFNGNINNVFNAAGDITNFGYDSAGNLAVVNEGVGSENEKSTTIVYDKLNRQLTFETDSGVVKEFSYDPAGNIVRKTIATGQIEKLTYDELDRLTNIEDPVKGEILYSYDSAGNMVEIVNGLEGKTFMEYDALNRLVRTSFDQSDVEYVAGYDVMGNLTSIVNPNGKSATFQFDLLGSKVAESNFSGKTKLFNYDLMDNLISITDFNGQTTNFSYDVLSRLTSITAPDNKISITYDANGNVLSVDENDSSLVFGYNSLNRISQVQTVDVGFQPDTTLNYRYDSVVNRVQLVDSEGGVTDFGYNDAGNILNVVAGRNIIDLGYDGVGRITNIGFPNSVNSTFQYDSQGRLQNLFHSNVSRGDIEVLSFGYDNVGHIISIENKEKLQSFSYNNIMQLVNSDRTGAIEQYDYDAAGNRVMSHLSDIYQYDDDNRLLEDQNFGYTYDDNGNISSKTSKDSGEVVLYSFDSNNQLVKIEFADGGVTTYRYDGIGRRIEKSVNGVIRRYVYDGKNLMLEYDGGNNLLARYLYGNNANRVLSMEREGELYFYHSDHLGSIHKLTDFNGEVVNSYSYDSYGNMVEKSENVANPFTYTGREFDSESGLYFYRSRYYDANVGRFVSKDPIGFAGGDVNLYRYVGGNPVNYIDPDGRISIEPVSCVVVVAGVGAALFTAGTALVRAGAETELRSLESEIAAENRDRAVRGELGPEFLDTRDATFAGCPIGSQLAQDFPGTSITGTVNTGPVDTAGDIIKTAIFEGADALDD